MIEKILFCLEHIKTHIFRPRSAWVNWYISLEEKQHKALADFVGFKDVYP